MNLRRRDKIALAISVSAVLGSGIGLAHVAPVSYLPGVQGAWEQRAQDMGVTVVFTDDERNCGAQIEGGYGGGCFDPATPDHVYLSLWMGAQGLERTALHELAHVWFFRQGIDETECMADRLAAKWGAVGPFFYCAPE